ncbi:MAG: hypothetical protein MUC48_23510, partial [Leptolyngbya sp. Prado105]|nr:hypothetical protein [Leptolyngbya sp. Prado105]
MGLTLKMTDEIWLTTQKAEIATLSDSEKVLMPVQQFQIQILTERSTEERIEIPKREQKHGEPSPQ